MASATPSDKKHMANMIGSINVMAGYPEAKVGEGVESITTSVDRDTTLPELTRAVIIVTLGDAENKLMDLLLKYLQSRDSRDRIGANAIMKQLYIMPWRIRKPYYTDDNPSPHLLGLRQFILNAGVDMKSLLESSPFQHTFLHTHEGPIPETRYIGPFMQSLIYDTDGGVMTSLAADKGNKIVIFTSFNEEVDMISALLDHHQVQHVAVTGKTKADEKVSMFTAFKIHAKVRVLVINMGIGETGLNLQCANIVYMTAMETCPFKVIQAVSRLHRAGQKKPVTCYHLSSDSFVEHNSILCQLRKLEKDMTQKKSDHTRLCMTQPLMITMKKLKRI